MLVAVSPEAHRLPLLPGIAERWRPASFAVEPWTLLRLCRYRRREAVEPEVAGLAGRMAGRAAALAEPVAQIRVVGVAEVGPDGARFEGGLTVSGRAVGALLAGCPLAAAFVLTLGPRLEREVAALTDRRELLEAFLLDTAGWAAIEHAVRALRVDLQGRGRAGGFSITHRLAPGYADWPLGEQRTLLHLLGEGEGLVRLTEYGVLVPFKSISGLFGLRPADR
jgi:hypothetical protein